MSNHFNRARQTLIAVGVIFIVNGLIIIGLRWLNVVRSPHLPVVAGPSFLGLGIVGMASAYFGLRSARPWAWVLLALAYVPWTLIGLISDGRQRLWPLVIAEAVGLIAIVLGLWGTAARMFQRRLWPLTIVEVVGLLAGLTVIALAVISAASRVFRHGG